MNTREKAKELAKLAQSLKNTCYHEVGHCVVARELGIKSEWEIIFEYEKDKDYIYTQFLGVTSFKRDNSLLTDIRGRITGLAGVVAEAYLLDSNVEPLQIYRDIKGGLIELSDTDRIFVSDYFSRQDVGLCLDIVKQRFDLITQDAESGFSYYRYLLDECSSLLDEEN